MNSEQYVAPRSPEEAVEWYKQLLLKMEADEPSWQKFVNCELEGDHVRAARVLRQLRLVSRNAETETCQFLIWARASVRANGTSYLE